MEMCENNNNSGKKRRRITVKGPVLVRSAKAGGLSNNVYEKPSNNAFASIWKS